MTTALAYEAQKAIIDERLRKAALVQNQLLAPDQTRRRIATRLLRWSAAHGYAQRRIRPA